MELCSAVTEQSRSEPTSPEASALHSKHIGRNIAMRLKESESLFDDYLENVLSKHKNLQL